MGIGKATLHRARFTRSDIEAHDTALKALFGYRAMRGLAFEASYADFGEMAKRDQLTGDVRAFNVSVVGLIPLRQVDLFGKAGFGAWGERPPTVPAWKSAMTMSIRRWE